MSLVWTIPPIAIALGAVLAIVQLRGLAEAAVDLQAELRRLTEVRLAVVEVRSEAAHARAIARGIHRA